MRLDVHTLLALEARTVERKLHYLRMLDLILDLLQVTRVQI